METFNAFLFAGSSPIRTPRSFRVSNVRSMSSDWKISPVTPPIPRPVSPSQGTCVPNVIPPASYTDSYIPSFLWTRFKHNLSEKDLLTRSLSETCTELTKPLPTTACAHRIPPHPHCQHRAPPYTHRRCARS